jgi:hypothetical protein
MAPEEKERVLRSWQEKWEKFIAWLNDYEV